MICGVISASGPNGEPLACAYLPEHEGKHSWATLPTFAQGTHTYTVHPDQDEWIIVRKRKGMTLVEAYDLGSQIIVVGRPDADSDHNCDAMGCSSVDHVLYRFNK